MGIAVNIFLFYYLTVLYYLVWNTIKSEPVFQKKLF
jgi:hypothetical protein